MKKVLFLFLTAVIFLSACSIKKRSYRPGYYLDFVSLHKKSAHSSFTKNKNSQAKKFTQIPEELRSGDDENSDLAFASAENKSLENILSRSSNHQLTRDSVCEDVINFRSGKVLTAKVLEITQTQVKYKRCDNLEGPLFSINKNDIANIRYPNGTVETFELAYTPTPAPVKRPVPQKSKRIHPLALLVLLFTILLPFTGLLSLFGIWLTAPEAEMKIKQNPDRYRGLKLLNICNTILRIYLGIAIALLILFIALILFAI